MANDLNLCQFIGRLGQDPKLTYMPNSNAVANISIAVGEQWRDKAGEKQERTTWVNVVAFGKLAEIMAQYTSRGSRIYLSGSLRTRKWEKDGQTHYTTEIVAKEMQLLDRKESDERNQNPIKKPEAGGFDDLGEEDIPW
jgi:single-strand DNA-binding protein